MCILCGSSTITKEKHYISHEKLQNSLGCKIAGSNLHYRVLQRLPVQDRYLICRHCAN